jgi:Gas vesicle protein K
VSGLNKDSTIGRSSRFGAVSLHTRGHGGAVTARDDVGDLEAMARELRQRLDERTRPARWNADPEDVKRSVMQLVLTLVDFIRQVLERQAVRRMEEGSLTADETERVGQALMQLEETVHDLARQAGLDPGDLNLDLGPLGRLR